MILDNIYQLLPLTVKEKLLNFKEYIQKGKMKEFHSQFINPYDTVFDIGANIGNYAQIYHELGAKVICLEPQPYCISKLKNKFRNNKDIVIVQKGVSDKEGMLELNLDSKNHATATFSEQFKSDGPFSNRKWDTKIKVPVTTLDLLIKEYGIPTYCKIDVEGFEYSVLKGLSKPIKYISFEYSQSLTDTAKKCMSHLETLGKPMYNFCYFNKPTKFVLVNWTDNKDEIVDKILNSKGVFAGDIYVKFE